MSIYALIIAITLSIDATVVSIANGIYVKNSSLYKFLELPIFFGFFQAFMPIFGYELGCISKGFFVGHENIIGAALIFIVGLKMVYEAIIPRKKENHSITPSIVLTLAIATSIDAFSVGASFAFIRHSIWILAILSGVVTLFFSFLGICLGQKMGKLFGENTEIISGFVLILLSLKILFGKI